MPTESTKDPSISSSIDFSKEIEVAEDLCKQALEKFKQVSVDRHSIQQSVIRNYLWLSVTILAAEFASVREVFNPMPEHLCPYVVLALSALSALAALIIGIRAMTGTTFVDPTDNFVQVFDYLTATGYHQGNHYALLKKEIATIKSAVECAYGVVNRRGKAMRKMNILLVFSICTGVFSGLLYLISTTT